MDLISQCVVLIAIILFASFVHEDSVGHKNATNNAISGFLMSEL